MNGSPLFTGDAGSGESEIRRFILENDLLEALIALPEQLFYNTGIATYVWVVTNRKAPARKGKVQLIDATSFWVPMRKSLGDKRREIPLERAQDILKILVRLPGRRDAEGGEGRQGRGRRRQPHLPDHPLRLPQDHRRAPAPAQLPGERRSASPASRRRRASRRWRSRRRRAPRARRSRPKGARCRRRSANSCGRSPARSSRTATSSSACSTPPRRRPASSSRPPVTQGHPLRALRARRDGRDLPRQGRRSRARPRAARHRERAARRERRGVLRARGQAPRPGRLDRHVQARPEGRPGRLRRLRDQLQPLLLPLHPAAPARGDRGRDSAASSRTSCGCWPR